MADNPYLVAPAPSYAAPIVNFFGGQNRPQPGQQQQQQNRPQGAMPQQNQAQQGPTGAPPWAQGLARWLGLGGQQGAMQPGTYQPNGPLNIQPGAAIPPNANPVGIY
jgi:hypothetical protein